MSGVRLLADNPLALHLLLERLEGLIDVVIPDENLHDFSHCWKLRRPALACGGDAGLCPRV
jgi:hypothetical protein